MTTTPELHAASFTGTLWGAIATAGGPRPLDPQAHLYPGAYDAGFLAQLQLPHENAKPEAQKIALARVHNFDRYIDDAARVRANDARPRTLVYESLHRDGGCEWLSLTTRYLTRLADSERPVICLMYESRPHVEGLGAHFDTWYGAIVQVEGAKTWHIGPGVTGQGWERKLTTHKGDILLLADGLIHNVSTPEDPGLSRHLAFAICRREPEQFASPTLLES
jgi:hypothetical protein